MRSVLFGIAGLVLGSTGGALAGIAAFFVGLKTERGLSSDGSVDAVLAGTEIGGFLLVGAVLGTVGGGTCAGRRSCHGLFFGTTIGLVVGLGFVALARPWTNAREGEPVNRLLAVTSACLACVVIGAIVGALATRAPANGRRASGDGGARCPHCGGALAAGAAFCRHCQRWLC